MGLLDGRVAFVTGTARGMGRNYAVRLAREEASVIGIDIAADCMLSDPFPATVDDISDAVIYLASDLSRAVTATQLTVDLGATKV